MKCFRLAILCLVAALAVACSSNGNDDDPVGPGKSVPVVTTTAVTAISETAAQGGGNVSSDGGATVSSRGICWSTSATPTTANNKTIDGSGEGTFTSSITGLTAGTTYHVRAYATNSVGTGYGSDVVFTTNTSSSTVTDIDGNVYQTVTIGSQVWMVENLKVTHYRNGDPIEKVTNASFWTGKTTGAYCEYDNTSSNVSTYGRLYNWYAVDDNRNIAPSGWHVPTDQEWKQLEVYLGMSQASADSTGRRGFDEGGKLKETGTTHWKTPNTSATNQSGFTGLPGGGRDVNGNFSFTKGESAFFWSSTSTAANFGWCRELVYDHSYIYRYNYQAQSGLSVRCVKD